jgi:hypothetical protein
MSFLDNLENNLKALESRDEGGLDTSGRRDRERQLALAIAPWAERLKSEPFARNLMQLATVAGRATRTKINLIWIGNTLRLEARGHRLELRPGPKGITAVFLEGTREISQKPINLSGDPKKLVTEWIPVLEEQKRRDDERAAMAADETVDD